MPHSALDLMKSMLSTSPKNRMKSEDVVRNLETLVDGGHVSLRNLYPIYICAMGRIIICLNNILQMFNLPITLFFVKKLKGKLPGKSVKLNYSLKEILGSGKNGDVYKGLLGQKPVAVKTIKMSDITEDIQKENKREEVLKFLNHPNVVKLLHVEDNEITKTQGR